MASDRRSDRRRRFEINRFGKSLQVVRARRSRKDIEWSSSDESEFAIRTNRRAEGARKNTFSRAKGRNVGQFPFGTHSEQENRSEGTKENSIEMQNYDRSECSSSFLSDKIFKNDSPQYLNSLDEIVPSTSPILGNKTINFRNMSFNKEKVSKSDRSTSPILDYKLHSFKKEGSFPNDSLRSNLENPKEIDHVLDCLEQRKNEVRSSSPILEYKRFKKTTNSYSDKTKVEPFNFVEYFSSTFDSGKIKTSQGSIESFHSSKVQSLEGNRRTSAVSNLTDRIESVTSFEQIPSCPDSDIVLIKSPTHKRASSINFGKNNDPLDSATKKKKCKFPRGSLADRLGRLIKKQESCVSLWRHENYMATHTTFDNPGESDDCLLLKILGHKQEYGIFLMNCTNKTKDESYNVIFNCHFIKNLTFNDNSWIRIYQPFKVYEIKNPDRCKVVVNVCKFKIIGDAI